MNFPKSELSKQDALHLWITCLDTDKSCEKCRIYPVRPEICKQFICDNEQRAKHNRTLLGQTRQIIDVRSEFYHRNGK